MPKYDFKNISTQIIIKPKPNPDILISLDDQNYLEEPINTRFIKKIEYKCPSGSILIKGLFDLSKVNIQDLIAFKYLSITFSPHLKIAYKQEFDTPKISINFKLLLDSEEIIKKYIHVLKKKFKDLDTDYKSFLKFNMEGFNDINILEMLNKIDEKDKIKYEFGISQLKERKNDFLEINDDIDDNIDEEENKNEIFNFFPLSSDNKEKDVKGEIRGEKNIIKKNKYIKVKDIESFKLDDKKVKIGSKILKKYILSNKNRIKEEISNNLLLPINFNSNLFKLGIDDKKEKIEFKNVLINDELKNLNQKYKKDILLNFLDLIIRHKNNTNKKNTMTINDYSTLVLSFIKSIEKKTSEIKKKNMKEKEYKYYILRLEKINSSLKLFYILFLNCFYSITDINNNENNFEYINNDDLYDDFFSLKVQTMRKKRLIEWCIQEGNNYINKTDLINDNKNKKKEILSRQIISFGQIKTAIKTNKNKNLFINSKISNLNQETSKKTLLYFLKTQNGRNEISKNFISCKANDSYADKINNTWISFLLQSLLYKEKKNEYITKSINLIEEKIKDMDDGAKPIIKDVFQLNFVLLKIYEKLINGNKDINNIEEYLNMLSNNNLLSRSNTDHFCQYIIAYILINIIFIIIPDLKEDNSLYKKNYFLLNQVINEILSAELNDDKDEENKLINLIMIIKLLYVSNINSKLKQKIFIDIISHQKLSSIESFWERYNKENVLLIDDLNKEYINAIYYLNTNNLLKAYRNLLKGKKYITAIDVYIKYFFSLIKENNFNHINYEEIFNNLKEIYEKSPSSFNEFNLDFFKYILFNAKKDEIEFEDIIYLLRKFISEYVGIEKSIYLDENSHRFIIRTLYGILIEKNIQNKKLVLCSELKLNELENLYFEDKNDLWINVLKDLLKHKNAQFSLDE